MPRCIRNLSSAIALIALAPVLSACTTVAPKPEPMPKVVHVTITRYVDVPASLTNRIPIPERASNRVQDVVSAYNRRGESLQTCDARLDAIRQLSGQGAPAPASTAPRPP